jgi:hypothetical protein
VSTIWVANTGVQACVHAAWNVSRSTARLARSGDEVKHLSELSSRVRPEGAVLGWYAAVHT